MCIWDRNAHGWAWLFMGGCRQKRQTALQSDFLEQGCTLRGFFFELIFAGIAMLSHSMCKTESCAEIGFASQNLYLDLYKYRWPSEFAFVSSFFSNYFSPPQHHLSVTTSSLPPPLKTSKAPSFWYLPMPSGPSCFINSSQRWKLWKKSWLPRVQSGNLQNTINGHLEVYLSSSSTAWYKPKDYIPCAALSLSLSPPHFKITWSQTTRMFIMVTVSKEGKTKQTDTSVWERNEWD